MDPFIECKGDPRAMGHGQGLAHRAEIVSRIAQIGGRTRRSRLPSLRALTSGNELGGGTGREVIRHYTHLAERMAGIARNADVPFSSLMDLFRASTQGAAPDGELVAAAIAFGARKIEDATGGPLVTRTLSGSSFESSPWILRKSSPEVGFASAEITLPWLASAVAGINAAGVAVAMAPRSASYGGGVNAGAVNPRHAPHAVLLVQECLQRFGDLDGCLDWCLKRPRSGNVSLIIADGAGRLAQVEVEGQECRVTSDPSGMALDGASRAATERIGAHFRDEHRLALDALSTKPADDDRDAVGSVGQRDDELVVWLEPARRNLSVRKVSEIGSAGKTIEISL